MPGDSTALPLIQYQHGREWPLSPSRSVIALDNAEAALSADLVDRVQSLIEAGAVPDLDVRRAHEARRAVQMSSLSGSARPGDDGQGLPHMADMEVIVRLQDQGHCASIT